MKLGAPASLADRVGRAGRPRDARLDAAIATATLELIVERGYNNLSLTAVADRAGTTTPAIYRRWSSKAELVLDTVLRTGGPDVVADTGDLEADVRTMIRWTLEKLGHPGGRAALTGLLGEPTETQRALRDQLDGVWAVVGDRLRRAADGGEIRSDVDVAAQIAALAGPALLVALFQSGSAADEKLIDELTAMVLDGMRPPHQAVPRARRVP